MSLANLLDISVDEKTKQCGRCKKHKPYTEFGREGGPNGYLRYECRACARKQSKIIENIRKTAPAIPKNHVCPICLRTEEDLTSYGAKKKTVFVLDHDHKTNQFRGYLCHKCNLGLGNLGDDIERMRRAIAYIQ